jgi:hypothetical protein
LIASPAAVAVWSGWVGLGTLCGFGVVHPLPGIADSFTIDTAVTLPVGVEAYGAYALRAWLTPGASKMARKFARWSAIGRLALGMLGQVIYHLLAAAHATRAPWPVVVLVSCLLVVTLGFGAALTHLLRAADGVLARVSIPVIDEAAGTVAPTVPDVAPTTPDAPEVERTVARRARRRPVSHTRKAERKYAPDLADGRVPSLRAVMADLHLGQDRARQVRAHLASLAASNGDVSHGRRHRLRSILSCMAEPQTVAALPGPVFVGRVGPVSEGCRDSGTCYGRACIQRCARRWPLEHGDTTQWSPPWPAGTWMHKVVTGVTDDVPQWSRR